MGERDRKAAIDQITDDARRVEILIADMQWDRLHRSYTSIMNLLVRHNKADYEVEERIYEIWARAMISILSAQSKGEPIKELIEKYQSALDVFRKCGRNKLLTWAESLTSEDFVDFPKFMSFPNAWARVDSYYADFHHEILPAFEGLDDEKTKVNWTNVLLHPELRISQNHLTTFFRFACQYSGLDINVHAYDLFANGDKFLPYNEVTVFFIDRFVNLTDSPKSGYEVNLSRKILSLLISIAMRTDVTKEVRARIILHAEKHPNIGSWFQQDLGTEWKTKLRTIN